MYDVKPPSINITSNFPANHKEECYECFYEICIMYQRALLENPELRKCFNIKMGADCANPRFTIYISLKEVEFIKKVIDKIVEYNQFTNPSDTTPLNYLI